MIWMGIRCSPTSNLLSLSFWRSRVHGLIFLFKWHEGSAPDSCKAHELAKDVYFAKQTVHNACATQAILSILLNSECQLGDELCSFKKFTADFTPELRGEAIGNAGFIRNAHNSFAPFPDLDKKEPGEEDAFHFVAYVPVCGEIFEFDGLAEGPIPHGKIADKEAWIHDAFAIIKDRIARYSNTM